VLPDDALAGDRRFAPPGDAGDGVEALKARVAHLERELAGMHARERAMGNPVDGASRIYRLRRVRDHLFGDEAGLFAEPAWDILLDLYVAGARSAPISRTSACVAASVPNTTGLRYLELLETKGLIETRDDAHDRRQRLVTISERARSAMEAVFLRMREFS
jgi:DNA-binding MarR family transcriptional regulator